MFRSALFGHVLVRAADLAIGVASDVERWWGLVPYSGFESNGCRIACVDLTVAPMEAA
jgi:hypothetical protein